MTEMKDPVRLSIGGSPAARDLLRSADADTPSRVQLGHLAVRLAPIVTKAAVPSIALWIVTGLAVLGVAGGVWYATREEPLMAPQAQLMREVARTVVTDEPPPAPVPEPVVVEGAPSPARVAKKKPVVEPIVVDKAPEPQPREMDLLGPAHEALRANDATRALALATRHGELYPRGTLSEEREAIAIEALQRLGRREARTRFDEFVLRFPRSGYRARLERLVTELQR